MVSQPVAQVIRVIPTIRDDGCAFANNWRKALFCMGYIRFVAAGNRDADGPARLVTHQMQLAIQPAFGQPYRPPVAGVFLTPFAAILWVLTCVASIMRV